MLEDHKSSVLIRRSNLRFENDIDLIAGNNSQLQPLTDKLDACAREYGMEISMEKSKIVVNAISLVEADIKLNGEHVEHVQAVKYFGSILTSDGCSMEDVNCWIAAT